MSRMLISFLIAYMLGLPETSSLAALAFSAQSAPQTPSLAELARGQPPRRPGTKVYTNDDLGSPRSSGAAEESAAESGPAAGPPVQAETASATEEEASAGDRQIGSGNPPPKRYDRNFIAHANRYWIESG